MCTTVTACILNRRASPAPTRRKTIRNLRRRFHHRNELCTQLETDERTYGSIGREASPTFAGWKDTPVIDLISVLQNQREYDETLKQRQLKARRLEEEEKTGEQC